MANPLPPPTTEQVVEPEQLDGKPNPNARLMLPNWVKYIVNLAGGVSTSANRVSEALLTGQNTALGSTSLLPTILNAGLYRLSYYTRVTTPAGVSSSLQITLNYTDHGAPQSIVGTAITTNTINSLQSNSFLIWADANAVLSYSTAYVSNAAGAMVYNLFVTLESVSI